MASIGQWIGLYLCVVAIMLPLDAVWLSTVGGTFYKSQLGPLLRESPALVPAAAFYLLYGVGIAVFAAAPAVRDGSLMTAAGYGALLGLIAYATYDLSNLATLKGYPLPMAMVDILWGTAVTAVAATGGTMLYRMIAGT